MGIHYNLNVAVCKLLTAKWREWQDAYYRIMFCLGVAISEARVQEDYQAAIGAAESDIQEARRTHQQSWDELRSSVADAERAAIAALDDSMIGSSAYRAYRLSFRDSCE